MSDILDPMPVDPDFAFWQTIMGVYVLWVSMTIVTAVVMSRRVDGPGAFFAVQVFGAALLTLLIAVFILAGAVGAA